MVVDTTYMLVAIFDDRARQGRGKERAAFQEQVAQYAVTHSTDPSCGPGVMVGRATAARQTASLRRRCSCPSTPRRYGAPGADAATRAMRGRCNATVKGPTMRLDRRHPGVDAGVEQSSGTARRQPWSWKRAHVDRSPNVSRVGAQLLILSSRSCRASACLPRCNDQFNRDACSVWRRWL